MVVVPYASGGGRVQGKADSGLGGRNQLLPDRDGIKNIKADHCTMESALSGGPNCRSGRAAQGKQSPQGDSGAAGAGAEKNAAGTSGRKHSLVLPENGRGYRTEPHDDSSHLGENEAEAAPVGSVYGQQRSGF